MADIELQKEKMYFLKYLRLEDLEIPLSLSTTIDKLVDMVQGEPLGISLMGREAARKEGETSFEEVETRINNYLRLLEDQPLEERTGQEKLERNVQLIFDERIRKLEATKTGRDAVKILSILSLLSPDEIYVGLVNGIFSKKNFNPHSILGAHVLVGDSDLRVQRALKLLKSNSLISIESFKIEYVGSFDMIKIHTFVQGCAQSSNPELLQPMETLQLIVDFFATNQDNHDFRGHILSILKFQEETTFCLEKLVLLSLLFEFTLVGFTNEEKAEVLRLLSSREWNAEEKLVATLIKIHAEDKSKEKKDFRGLKELMLELPEEFIRKGWILQLCTELLRRYMYGSDRPDRRTLSWLKKCYIECPSVNRYFRWLLKCIYKDVDSVVDAEDGEFVLKLFSTTSETERRRFWIDMRGLAWKDFKRVMPFFFPTSGETNLFVKSLEFSMKELKIKFLKCWAEYFEPCFNNVMENDELREKLLATEEFATALKDITEFGFHTREFDDNVETGILHLLLIWMGLFTAHEPTYKTFGSFLDRLVIDLPESTKSDLAESIYCRGSKSSFRKLASLEYCSTTTESWIETLTRFESEAGNSSLDRSSSDYDY